VLLLKKKVARSLSTNAHSYCGLAFKQPFTNIALKNVTTYEIVKELKNKNSCGYDEVTVKI
jgi:hypothetical protein